MKISVIIPTYKSCDTMLGHCLRSLEAQTLPSSDFEVIVVRNGDVSEGYDYFRSLPTSFPNLNIKLLNIKKAGVSNARNKALAVAKGEYLCFIDDDDWVSADYLQKLLEHANTGVLATSYVAARKDVLSPDQRDYVGETYMRFEHSNTVGILEGRRFLCTVWGKLIPRQMIGNTLFDIRFSMGEDALFMATISRNIEHIMPASGKPTYYRRLNQLSATRNKRSMSKRLSNTFKLWRAYTGVYLSAPREYNTMFFANRLAAVTKWLFNNGLR